MSASTSGPMNAPVRCRVCACTHDAPCVLPHGDTCLLSIPTGLCNNPRCVRGAMAAARADKSRRREELAALVRPVLDSFRRQWARKRRPGQPKRTKASKPKPQQHAQQHANRRAA